jgi:hypothetical protein
MQTLMQHDQNIPQVLPKKFSMGPRNYAELITFVEIFVQSSVCPENLKSKPADAVPIALYGMELGFGLMTSFDCVGCIKGKPFLYGPGFLAKIVSHPACEWFNEWIEGEGEDMVAHCVAKRKGWPERKFEFSMKYARKCISNVNKKTWIERPDLMLKYKARTLAGRDVFPDALYGIADEQEAEEMAYLQDVTPKVVPISKMDTSRKGISGLKDTLGITSEEPEMLINKDIKDSDSEDLKTLKELIVRLNVREQSIRITFNKFGIDCFEGLTGEQILKWISVLRIKEEKIMKEKFEESQGE